MTAGWTMHRQPLFSIAAKAARIVTPVTAAASRLSKLLSRAAELEAGSITLTQRRIFILPTRPGLLFGVTMLGMLLGCINYTLSSGYILTFLVTSVGIVSVLHTFRNLAHLQIRAGRCGPVFVGDFAVFPVLLDNPTRLSRMSIALRGGTQTPIYTNAPASDTVRALIRVPATTRGTLPFGLAARLHDLSSRPVSRLVERAAGCAAAWSIRGRRPGSCRYPMR